MNQPADQPGTRIEEIQAPHNLVAVFPHLRVAREAIKSLEDHGIEGSHISLLGAESPDERGQVDEGSFDEPEQQVGTGVLGGAAAGAAAGGLGGIAIGIPGLGPVIAAGIWAVFGAGVGGAIGGVSQLGISRAWNETFRAVEAGDVCVGVHSPDPDEVAEAEEVLDQLEPLRMMRFDDGDEAATRP